MAPAVQTTYPETMRAAVAGMIANTEHKNVISRTIETAAGVGFGLAVVRGSDDDGAILPTATGQDFLGITVRDITLAPGDSDEFQQYDDASILEEGVIWVVATGEAVNAGDPVVFNFTDGTFRTTDDASHDLVAGAVWDSSAASGELAKIRLRK